MGTNAVAHTADSSATPPAGTAEEASQPGATGSAGRSDGRQQTGTDAPEAADRILAIRNRINEIDDALIALWKERAELSRQVGAVRIASGGTRLVLSREREIVDRYRSELGADGIQLALLVLRAGRGPL
ncbi:chorismate mutase [Micromonospora sp. LOL_021]|uniref:chorismate mutase n=1 Tax=Micromonospora sp. LOL_021 TaxID=3345417 RepID=UPI003A87CC75